MDVSDLIFSDYAASNEKGKFTLVGAGFSEIYAKQIPCVHPLMFVLVRLKITLQDKGAHKIAVRMVGEKGAIFKAEANINVGDSHTHEKHIAIPIRLQNLRFELPGEYNCEVLVDGELKQSHILRIIQAPAGPPRKNKQA